MTKNITRMEIDDAEHYTPEQRQAIIDSYPEHEREARTKGIPSLGSGRVFPIAEDAIRCDPIPIPEHWYQLDQLATELGRLAGRTLLERGDLRQPPTANATVPQSYYRLGLTGGSEAGKMVGRNGMRQSRPSIMRGLNTAVEVPWLG